MISRFQKEFEWEYYRDLREQRALENTTKRIRCAFCGLMHHRTNSRAGQWGYAVSKDWRIKLGKWIVCQERGERLKEVL